MAASTISPSAETRSDASSASATWAMPTCAALPTATTECSGSPMSAMVTLIAIDDDWVGGNRLNVPKDQWLSAGQISEKLTTQGYRVHEIEVDDGAYEVELIDKNGTRVDAHVHPATAEILIGYDD